MSLFGRTAGVFRAFPLNSTGGEVDGWRGVGMGKERSKESKEANGSLCYL